MRRQIALLTLLVFAVGIVLRLESAAAAPPSSLQFDGANDIVRTANLPLLTQFTVEAWVKRTADAGTWQTFLSDANSSYSQAMFTLYVDGGSRDCSGVSDQFAFYQASGSSLQCSGVTAAPGVWYHVAVSRDANGARRLFVNGVLRSTQTNSPAPTDSSGVLTFGRAGDFAGEYFAGLIDEARLSNVAVYTADFAPPVAPLNAEAGTIALWHFDEGAGQTTTDASGNARTGILGTSASADSADPAWSTDSPIGAAPSTPTASATAVATPTATGTATATATPTATPAASVTPTDGATSPAATPTATASTTPAATDLASVTPTPSLTPLPSEVGYALRFFGNGQNDIDRVKIQIDDPANTNPGPPADVGAQDFTLEFWMKANAADNPAAAVACGANNNWIFGHVVIDRDRFNQDRKFGLSLAGGRVVFGVAGEGAGSLTLCGVTPVLDGQWHHVAVQRRRSDGWLWLYVDGLLQAQADGPDGDISYPDDGVPGNFCGGPCTNSDPYLVFGAEKHDAGPEYRSYNGHLDEVRLSNSLRYSADFTRPAQPFMPDAATVALYHFDEGAGDMIGDTSGAAGGPSHGVRRFGGSPAGPLWVVDSPFPPPTATPTPTDSSPLTPTATDAPAASETPTGTSTATSAPSPTATAPPSSTATATAPPSSTPTRTATPTSGTPGPAQLGQWTAPITLPLAPVHLILQTTGELLMFDEEDGGLSATLWDPVANTFTAVPNTQTYLFCAGHSLLADGRTITIGGHLGPNYYGLPDTNFFDPAARSWTRMADMAYPRWYPTSTTLPDGRVLAISGWITTQSLADVPEVYDPATNTWTALTAATRYNPMYSFMLVAPDGTVFNAGPDISTRSLNVAAQTWTNVGNSFITGHSAVMYAPGRVMKSGTFGDPDDPASSVHGRTVVIDLNQPAPAWREVAAMASPRAYHNLVQLPDGTVLAVGGERTAIGNNVSQAVYTTELWNPQTETWTTMASLQRPRLYHSTALLLPDGRVVSAGGYFPPYVERNAQIYSPPYLFRGPRPTILSAPASVGYGAAFTVETNEAAGIASVSLIRLPSTTHGFDQNQRFVPLTFQAAGNALTVQSPANANLAPPGHYMLFIVDGAGVPSVASLVRLDASAPPPASPTPTTPPASSPTNTPGAPPTATNTPTASRTATSTPTATTAPSDLIFADGFESGNLSAWSASVVDGGDLSVAAAAALVGGQGLQAVLDDNVSLYLTDDRPAAETRYRARFYFDPNTIAMTNGDAHFLFYGYAGTSTLVTRLEFRRSSGVYQIRAALRNDASTYTSTSWFTLSDAPHAVEIDWRAASGAGANNGGLTLWLDGVQRADLTGVDNDTRRIDRVQLGAVAGVDSGTRGTYYFDAFESRRQTYIGLDPGQPPASTPTPTLPPTFTPTPAPSATPGGNAALSFDGVNDELRAAAVTGTGPLTVEAWVRPAAAGANDILIINGDANTGWSLEINSGRLTFWLSTNLGWRSVQHATALQSGQWYHVAGTYSGGSAQVFVNGSASGSASVGTLSQGPSLRLGGMAGFPYFAGVLDEVRLSNVVRYSGAFTPAARFTPDAGTLALWHLDEGAGQSAADASASANHATLGASTGADSADPAWTAGGP